MHEPANSRLECPGYFTKEQPEEGPKKNNPMYDRSLLSLWLEYLEHLEK